MTVVASKQTDSKQFYHSGRMAAQCRTANRRCCTFPAMEPNRATVEIVVPYTYGAEIHAADEVPSTRGAPAGKPEGSRSGGGGRCAACAALRSLWFLPGAPSSAGVILLVGMQWQQMQAEDIDTARTKACGNTLQMAARRLLGQQVAKRVDGAVGRINRSTETEIGHLSLESLSMEQAPCKPPSKVAQCWLAKIKAGHFVTSGGQLDN